MKYLLDERSIAIATKAQRLNHEKFPRNEARFDIYQRYIFFISSVIGCFTLFDTIADR